MPPEPDRDKDDGVLDRTLWTSRLHAIAAASLASTPWSSLLHRQPAAHPPIDSFRDGAGHRRPVDPLLLASLIPGEVPAHPRPATDTSLQLWHDLVSGRDPERALVDGTGPLVAERAELTIETWTERELMSLHALSWMAIRLPGVRPRVASALRWLIDEIQPDNATNRPWAIHVFAHHAAEHSDPEAMLYAETLLHNCHVGLVTPDRFSGLILLSAARWLEWAQSRPASTSDQ